MGCGSIPLATQQMFTELLLCPVGIVGEKEKKKNNEETIPTLTVLPTY